MDELGVVKLAEIALFGNVFSYHKSMIIMTWIVMAILVLMAIITRKKINLIPSRIQSLFELIIEFLDDITVSTLGKKDGRKFLPLICAVFMFILLSNWISILPNIFRFFGAVIAAGANMFGSELVTFTSWATLEVDPSAWYSFLIKFPNIEEPTKFLATDLGLSIMILIIAHTYGIRQNGIGNYLKGYMGDVWPTTGFWKFIFFLNPFLYMNILGEISNTVSHAFRLFGNIFGGGMIVVIVSSLIHSVIVPVGLLAFFGLFAGIVQAFVFTMLTVTYIAQQKA
ncbi:F0F1 ATP synthase subunit A [bacterium]|jgi:F-type H+-transporting ATPase subunit a|nr:F0F1 ATP synthase subunit A [bacterium]